MKRRKRSLGGRDTEKFTVKTELIYNKENREEFFAKIDELTEKDKHTECINALESIPAEERDYEITYQLARALQNFAIVGDDDKGTEYNRGYEVLLKSLDILESVRAEGIDRPEWNMRMAYGYQYLFHQEERAIPYAQRWAELDPEDKNALEVVKECQEEIEKRKKTREKYAEIEGVVKEEFEAILKEHGIENVDDYNSISEEEFEAIYETITKVQEKYDLHDDYTEGLLHEVLVGDEDDGEIIEDWGGYLCRWSDGQLASVRLNLGLALLEFDPQVKYTKRIQLSVMLKNPDEDGLPIKEEEETLYHIEDLLESIIKEKEGILAGFLRWDKRLSIFAYVEDEKGYEEAFAVALKEQFPDYEYKFWVDEDEEWETYFNALYPDKYNYQGILNNRLIYQIQMDGDTMVPRVLEHCLYFKTKEKRKEFLEKVETEGFRRIEERADEVVDETNEYPYQLVVGREDDFKDTNRVTWYLMETAEELDGEYDGWGCVTVKE